MKLTSYSDVRTIEHLKQGVFYVFANSMSGKTYMLSTYQEKLKSKQRTVKCLDYDKIVPWPSRDNWRSLFCSHELVPFPIPQKDGTFSYSWWEFPYYADIVKEVHRDHMIKFDPHSPGSVVIIFGAGIIMREICDLQIQIMERGFQDNRRRRIAYNSRVKPGQRQGVFATYKDYIDGYDDKKHTIRVPRMTKDTVKTVVVYMDDLTDRFINAKPMVFWRRTEEVKANDVGVCSYDKGKLTTTAKKKRVFFDEPRVPNDVVVYEQWSIRRHHYGCFLTPVRVTYTRDYIMSKIKDRFKVALGIEFKFPFLNSPRYLNLMYDLRNAELRKECYTDTAKDCTVVQCDFTLLKMLVEGVTSSDWTGSLTKYESAVNTVVYLQAGLIAYAARKREWGKHYTRLLTLLTVMKDHSNLPHFYHDLIDVLDYKVSYDGGEWSVSIM